MREPFWQKGSRGESGIREGMREETAQATLEYAITTAAILAIILGLAALWRAVEDGSLSHLAERAASHALSGLGALDISLY